MKKNFWICKMRQLSIDPLERNTSYFTHFTSSKWHLYKSTLNLESSCLQHFLVLINRVYINRYCLPSFFSIKHKFRVQYKKKNCSLNQCNKLKLILRGDT